MKMLLYRFVRRVFNPLQRILWPTKIIHRENFNKLTNGGIVICNHYSTPDSIIIASQFFKKELHALAKADLFKGLGGFFLRKFGCIPVKRGEPDIDAYKSVMKILKADKIALIFPEGTRNKDGTKQIAPLKNGVASFAVKTGKPVLPMLYYQMHKLFRRNYLIVGEPISFADESFDRKHLQEATEYISNKMNDIRTEVDKIVEDNSDDKISKGDK